MFDHSLRHVLYRCNVRKVPYRSCHTHITCSSAWQITKSDKIGVNHYFIYKNTATVWMQSLRYVTLPHPKPQVSLPVPLACLIIYNISYTYLQKDSNVGQPQRGFNPLANPIFDSPVYFDLFIQWMLKVGVVTNNRTEAQQYRLELGLGLVLVLRCI